MVLDPILLPLALLPPLALHARRAGAAWVIAAGAGGWAALGIATLALAPAAPDPAPGAHHVAQMDFTGIEAFAFLALAAAFLVAALAEWIKTRLVATTDRTTTLAGFWMAHASLVLTNALPGPEALLSALEVIALAGALTLIWAILLRPTWRAIAGPRTAK